MLRAIEGGGETVSAGYAVQEKECGQIIIISPPADAASGKASWTKRIRKEGRAVKHPEKITLKIKHLIKSLSILMRLP